MPLSFNYMRINVLHALIIVLLLEGCCVGVMCKCWPVYFTIAYKTAAGGCWSDSTNDLKILTISKSTGDTVEINNANVNPNCELWIYLQSPENLYHIIHSDSLGLSDTLWVNSITSKEGQKSGCCKCPVLSSISATLNGQTISADHYTRILP